ncbi:type IV-A pilus assembly ATPase PilB [uncultured Abyssibacter sp.]|uniref:type IV-A pilus assembly ATPase PilB n=1 Tax=uncultured Abyssibacter sp. TaxID=2320202 RepID=UPI0032B25324
MGYIGGLARRLINDGLLTDAAAREAQAKSSKDRIALVHWVVSQNLASALDVGMAASREFGLPLLDLNAMNMEYAPISEVSQALIRDHRALPLFKRGKRLYVATSDPTNLQGLDEIKFNTGLTTEPVLVEDDKLGNFIENALNAMEAASLDVGDEDLENIDLDEGDDAKESEDITRADTESAPVVRFVNKILLDAINRGASDIHFEPYEKKYRVRYRQDGILQEIATPPVQMGMRLAARLKVMSRMDLAERRVPQDGRIKLNLSKTKAIDFRVNTCPTLFGEKIVLRILDPTSAQLGIDALGYEPHQKELYLKFLSKPYGMILVTGPTGSGKTVSLYTGLNILNTADRNISTAEDPAEINLPGINQVNVNPKVGLTFASALKAFLRQDPDIIMVGEIRDLETAEIAIKAAQTGHLVLSTLHTNDAPQTLTRMLNMGVPAYNIASSVSLIIAQRLARRLCKQCKQPIDIPREELIKEGFLESDLENLTLYEAKGCDACSGTGYKGRVGIYQVMPVNEDMGRAIMEGSNAMELAQLAKQQGIDDLRRSGLLKVLQGVTSLVEVNRVTVD